MERGQRGAMPRARGLFPASDSTHTHTACPKTPPCQSNPSPACHPCECTNTQAPFMWRKVRRAIYFPPHPLPSLARQAITAHCLMSPSRHHRSSGDAYICMPGHESPLQTYRGERHRLDTIGKMIRGHCNDTLRRTTNHYGHDRRLPKEHTR